MLLFKYSHSSVRTVKSINYKHTLAWYHHHENMVGQHKAAHLHNHMMYSFSNAGQTSGFLSRASYQPLSHQTNVRMAKTEQSSSEAKRKDE